MLSMQRNMNARRRGRSLARKIVASPPDVRKVSDLPQSANSFWGYAPMVFAEIKPKGGALIPFLKLPEGQRPSAHRAAEPR
jgi:hypothetical protein